MPVSGGRGPFRVGEFWAPAQDFRAPIQLTPGTGALVLTGFAPAVPRTVIAGAGALTLTGFAPTLPRMVIPGVGALVLTGFAPTVTTGGAAPAVVVVVGGRPRRHPIRRKRKRMEAEVQALAAQIAADLTPPPAPWEADDETVLDLLLMDLLE